MVRNRDPKASSSFNQELEEAALFSQEPWLEIPEQQRGTANLKCYLGHLLCKRIREGFPELQRSVEDKLQEQEARLERLGKPRAEHSQQRNYLRDIVKTYEDLASKSLTSPAELPSDEIKLRGLTQTLNAVFAKMMMKEGHKYHFLDIGEDVEVDWAREDSDSESDSRTITVVSFWQASSADVICANVILARTRLPYNSSQPAQKDYTNALPSSLCLEADDPSSTDSQSTLHGNSKADRRKPWRGVTGDAEPYCP